MNRTYSNLRPLVAFFSVVAVILTTTGATSVTVAASSFEGAPIVTIDGGAVRGVAVAGGYAFRGLPYAAAPIGNLRWLPPQPPAEWQGVRDATAFAPSCPQTAGSATAGPTSEDCLYLNVYTPELSKDRGGDQSAEPDGDRGGGRL